jgi:iron complex outermembrane receptor protein
MRLALLGSTAFILSTVLLRVAAAEEAGAPAEDTTRGLEEVVVTAQHRVEDKQKTPIAITTVTGEQLQEQGKTTLDAALKDVPALQVQASPQGGQIFIRGVGANGDSNWIDPDVSLMFDNVYSGRAEAAMSSLYDLNRVEVLRGPQGTLYGRNATGGVVNILTNDPVLDRYQAGLNLEGGNYDLRHEDGYVNVPIDDTLALRVAADHEAHNGFYTNGGGAEDDSGIRGKLLWKPTESFSLLATADYWRQMGQGNTTVPTGTAVGPQDIGNPWNVEPLQLGPATIPLLADRDNYKFATYSLKADWDLGWSVLSLIPSYSYSDRYVLTNLFAPGPQTSTTWSETQYTGEARLQSPAGSPVTWVAGLYVLSSDETVAGVGAGGATFLAYPPSDHPASSVAPFAQVTYPILDDLRVTGGLRYTIDDKTVQYQVCSSQDGETCDGRYTSPKFSDSNNYSALTYKAGLEYDLAKQSMLYAQIATGYKAGGWSTSATPPVSYKPEHLTAYEIGSKNRFLDNRLEINAELYYYDYSQYQVQYATYIPYTLTVPAAYIPAGSGEEFQQFVGNAASGTNMGGEVETRWRVTPDDQIDGSLSYTQATYGQLVVPTAGGPPGSTTPSGYFDLTGTAVANSPKWIGKIGYEHSWDLYGGTLAFRMQSKLSTDYWAATNKWYGGARQAGYTSSDLNLNYVSGDSAWSAALWAKNLENGAQKVYVYPFYRAQLSNPQTFGLTLSYHFDQPSH